MIKKLILKNFQIHKKLELEFDKNFNVIVGSNDSGKSSIIRAIHWVFYNSPSGDWMRRINEDGEIEECSVKIVFDDDTVVKRIKGEGINRYIINDQEYDNFGYDVPEEVINRIKIYKFKTNKTDFNIHISMQDDQPFLIHEASTVKASVVDVLTGASIIQKGITEFNSDARNTKSKLNTYTENIEELQKELEALPNLEFAITKLDSAKLLEEKLSKLSLEISWSEDLLTKYVKNKKVIKRLENISKLDVGSLNNLEKKIYQLEEYIKNLTVLKNKLTKLKSTKYNIPNFDEIRILFDSLEKKKQNLSKLENLLECYKDSKQKFILIEKEIVDANLELEKFKKENPTCPVCNKEW